MKIAFLVMADKDPLQFARLIKTLDDPRFDIFVHIDAKSDMEEFQKAGQALQYSHISFLQKRISIYWGDISMVEAMLALYQTAMETEEYCRYVLLSGCDYPVVSNDALWKALSSQEKEYIKASPLPEHKLIRIQYFWAWKIQNVRIFGLIKRVMGLLWKKKTYITVQREKWPVFTSSQWVALTGSCMAYCWEVLQKNPCIMRYFRYSYAPDELLLPTIIANSPAFSQKAVYISRDKALSFDELPATHYLRYEARKGSTVRIFEEDAFDEIRASGKMFVRKVYSGKSEGLCEKLDAARKAGD